MPLGRTVLTGKAELAAGQRDKAVTIQQKTQTVGGSGFPVETWTTLASSVWMARRDLKADERFKANQEASAAEARWILSYRPDMDPEILDVPNIRRLVFKGRTHDIVTATLIGRQEGIEVITVAATEVA